LTSCERDLAQLLQHDWRPASHRTTPAPALAAIAAIAA
jgi:hypothetical protein